MKANFDNRINQLRNDLKHKITELVCEDVDEHVIFADPSGVMVQTDNGPREVQAVFWDKEDKSLGGANYKIRYDLGKYSYYLELSELATDTLNALYKALYKELNGEEEG